MLSQTRIGLPGWPLWLEELDGRDMISHPQYGLYTGLAAQISKLRTDGLLMAKSPTVKHFCR